LWSLRAAVAAAPPPPNATLSVPDDVTGPPVRPAPEATEVTVPGFAVSVAQIQAVPFHLATWPLAQARPPSTSLSASSANPAGLPLTPVQGALAPNRAWGDGVSSCPPGARTGQ
jgi:hypothetical protein